MFHKLDASALAALAIGFLGVIPVANAEIVCRQNPAIETLRDWESCDVWCPGAAGRQLFQCWVPRGASMHIQRGYLVRSASGTHYIISDGNGNRLTQDYNETCEALLAYCR